MKSKSFKIWLTIWIALSLLFRAVLSHGSHEATTEAAMMAAVLTLMAAAVWYFVRYLTRFRLVKTILGRSVVAIASGTVSGIVLHGMGLQAGAGIGGGMGLLAMGLTALSGKSNEA